MAKVGRNEPCPCGSGKKYKKCCLAKDEAAARLGEAEIAVAPPSAPTPTFGLGDPLEGDELEIPIDPDDPMEADDEDGLDDEIELDDEDDVDEIVRRADDRDDRRAAASWVEQIAIFHEALADDEADPSELADIIVDLREEAESAEQKDEIADLIDEIHRRRPEDYAEDHAFYQQTLLEFAVQKGDLARVSALLEPLLAAPVDEADSLTDAVILLLYHGYTELALDVLRAVWPRLSAAPERPDVYSDLFATYARLTVIDYATSQPAPRWDDPELRQRLDGIGESNREGLRAFFSGLTDSEPGSLNLAAFTLQGGKKTSPHEEQIEQRILPSLRRLAGALLIALRNRPGASSGRCELAVELIEEILWERASDGMSGVALLVPEVTSWTELLTEVLELDLGGDYLVASALEALPAYLDFLAQCHLIPAWQQKPAARAIRAIQSTLRVALLGEDCDAQLIETVSAAMR